MEPLSRSAPPVPRSQTATQWPGPRDSSAARRFWSVRQRRVRARIFSAHARCAGLRFCARSGIVSVYPPLGRSCSADSCGCEATIPGWKNCGGSPTFLWLSRKKSAIVVEWRQDQSNHPVLGLCKKQHGSGAGHRLVQRHRQGSTEANKLSFCRSAGTLGADRKFALKNDHGSQRGNSALLDRSNPHNQSASDIVIKSGDEQVQ